MTVFRTLFKIFKKKFKNLYNQYIENWNILFFYEIISLFRMLKELGHSLTRLKN